MKEGAFADDASAALAQRILTRYESALHACNAIDFDDLLLLTLKLLHEHPDVLETCRRTFHYVMVDDKLRILTAMKNGMGNRLTSIFPRQGHYAHDPNNLVLYPSADITLERIGDLVHHDFGFLSTP